MRQITTWMNYAEQGVEIIPIDPVSKTTPDMTMSLQELLDRHTQGREVPEFHGTYDDENLDEYFPDLRRLDLVEIQELQQAVLDDVQRARLKLSKLSEPQNEVDPRVNPKEVAERTSDPKQQSDAGATKSGEADKPQPSAGQQH